MYLSKEVTERDREENREADRDQEIETDTVG